VFRTVHGCGSCAGRIDAKSAVHVGDHRVRCRARRRRPLPNLALPNLALFETTGAWLGDGTLAGGAPGPPVGRIALTLPTIRREAPHGARSRRCSIRNSAVSRIERELSLHQRSGKGRQMEQTAHVNGALTRLRVVFCARSGAELTDTDVATLAGLDDEECRILLRVLRETGAIEQPRSRVFTCPPSSWWTTEVVRGLR
jgi:hypothetical protein